MLKALRAIRLLRKHGIKYPIITYRAAKDYGLELAVLAAVLEQETGGGRNVFGHDPTIFIGAGKVTKRKYLAYRKQRGPKGEGGMQGVGPMQLTWYAFQNLADAQGGCWKPRVNIRVGAQTLARNVAKHNNLRSALKVYNGSWDYADQVLRRVEKWRRLLHPPLMLAIKPVQPRQGFSSLHASLWTAYSAGRRRGFTDLGTYANKPGDHGFWPAWAFDLGDKNRFFFKGWGYIKARRLAKWYVKHHEELNIENVILGRSVWSRWSGKQKAWNRTGGWHKLTTGDTSHDFHIHVSGHH
jgi:hypothetical protein